MLILLLLNAVLQANDAEIPRFEQDRFVISFWVDPPLDDKADERYKEIADAGFNLVMGGFGATTVESITQQLELCEKYGMKALVTYHGIDLDALPDSPALWGFKIRDEPSATEFPELAKVVQSLRESHPGKLAYINLFPNYASPWGQLGTENYDEYVRRFVDETDIDVLCMDHYPIFKPDGDTRDNYCKDLETMRQYSLKADIPFWNFFNIMPYGPHTDPTEAQVRWQVFASLTYGAKGVLYFCYYTPGPGGEFPKGGAIISRDDRRTRHYYQARRLNEQLNNLGPTLMQLTSTGVYRVSPDDTPAEVLKGSPVLDLLKDDVDPPLDLLVGTFDHADGRRAVMLTNYRFAFSAWPQVVFDVPVDEIREIDKWSGEEIPVYDDSPDLEGLHISLEDGEGRLFLLPPKASE